MSRTFPQYQSTKFKFQLVFSATLYIIKIYTYNIYVHTECMYGVQKVYCIHKNKDRLFNLTMS